MNKNVKRALIGSIAGVSVALGGAWYVAAGQIVDGTKALIDGVNGKTRADGHSIKITYDSLTRTMFPAVGVRLVNPSIEVNSPGLPVTKMGAPATAPEPFHVTWKHTGTVDVITDYLAKEYRLVNDGNGVGSLETSAEKVGITSAPSHSELAVKAKDRAAFTQWQSLDLGNPTAVKQALTQVGGAHVAAGAMKLTDASGATILTQEQAKFDLTNQSDDKKIKFDVALLSKGSQVTKEYSDLVVRMLTMLRMPAETINAAMPMSAVRAGKQDIDLAVNADFPLATPNQPTPSGDIHVTRLNLTNDFYHLSAPTDVVLHEDAAGRHASIKLNWSLAISPTGAKEMEGMLDSALPLLSNMYGAATPAIDPVVLKQKIVAALPVVSTLGPMTLVLDVDANIPRSDKTASESSPTAKSESLNLRQFTFAHKRWAIDAKGEASRTGDVNGTLTCKQCTTLTQDMFETARASQEVTALLQPANPVYPFTEAMLTQLNTTLAEIGKPGAATGDLDFVVTTPAANDTRLNDQPIGQVVPKLLAIFAQPPSDAPAPVQPAPVPQQSTPSAPAI